MLAKVLAATGMHHSRRCLACSFSSLAAFMQTKWHCRKHEQRAVRPAAQTAATQGPMCQQELVQDHVQTSLQADVARVQAALQGSRQSS